MSVLPSDQSRNPPTSGLPDLRTSGHDRPSGPIVIDGSQGEGGGQILRSSLSLSAVTGIPVRVEHIRAKRPKPGLARQHLTSVLAAAQVCGAQVEGAELGSRELTFHPQTPLAGDYHFDIGSAGGCSLVLQTVLPILLRAAGPSRVVICGGTHNGMAPPFEFLRDVFCPLLHRCGASVTVELERHGFYPAGGGRLIATVQPWSMPVPLDVVERGRFVERRAVAVTANLPAHVGEREARTFKHALHWSHAEVDETSVSADGPGNIFLVWLRYAQVCEVISVVGEQRKSAERVAQEVARDTRRYLESTAAVGEHAADQLLLPLVLGAGGRFSTLAPSEHLRTNAAVIAAFLGERVQIQAADDRWLVGVQGSLPHE
jgi:RNA 3'-terminal phosphate cyclase (ATP)